MADPATSPGSRASLRALLSLAWPIVLARATQAVIGFTDALMVAPLGEAPLAAATTGALNSFAVIILPMGTVFIIQSFAAQLRGRGDLEGVRRYAHYGLLIALAAGVLAACAYPFVPWLLSWFRYAPEVHALMSTYLGIRLLSTGAAVGTEALGNWYGGLGNTRPSMVAGVVTMAVNIALNYLLIEPRLGLPGYGVAGAAWASVVASWTGFAVIAAGFSRGLGYARTGGSLPLDPRELLRVLRFGLPNGVNWFLEFAAFALFVNYVVTRLGTSALAAFNVVMQINAVSFMPAFGIASSGAILVGEAIGRRAYEEVWPLVKLTGSVAGTWMMSIGLVYVLLPGPLFGLFEPRTGATGDLMRIGVAMLMWSAVWQLFDALSLTLGEALRAAGDTTWCMVARIVLAWLVFTPAAWTAVLVLGGGVPTVMLSLVAYLAALSLAFGLRFAAGRWRTIDLVGGGRALDVA
jgi:multidrug resistance protein, MATE family